MGSRRRPTGIIIPSIDLSPIREEFESAYEPVKIGFEDGVLVAANVDLIREMVIERVKHVYRDLSVARYGDVVSLGGNQFWSVRRGDSVDKFEHEKEIWRVIRDGFFEGKETSAIEEAKFALGLCDDYFDVSYNGFQLTARPLQVNENVGQQRIGFLNAVLSFFGRVDTSDVELMEKTTKFLSDLVRDNLRVTTALYKIVGNSRFPKNLFDEDLNLSPSVFVEFQNSMRSLVAVIRNYQKPYELYSELPETFNLISQVRCVSRQVDTSFDTLRGRDVGFEQVREVLGRDFGNLMVALHSNLSSLVYGEELNAQGKMQLAFNFWMRPSELLRVVIGLMDLTIRAQQMLEFVEVRCRKSIH